MGRVATPVVLTDEDKRELQSWRRRRNTRAGLFRRAGIILDCARGLSGQQIAERHETSEQTVSKWRKRYIRFGLQGLSDAPRPGQPRRHDDEEVQRVVDATLNTRPSNATHWSVRSLAEQLDIKRDFIHRVWKTFGLKPHLVSGFILSDDPHFVEKVRDVVGLYMNPPQKALVLCVDEKTQIQALDRTQPSLPMSFGLEERQTHDYRRYGTTTLFAALDVATGKVIGQLKQRHRSEDFIKFLRHIDKSVPEELDVHVILDNYQTHKTEKVKRWLMRHPRFHFHFIPTYSSWLNLVERFFATLTMHQLRRGTHRSTRALENAIRQYLNGSNETAKPFIWTKAADEIIDSVARVFNRINQTGH